MAGLEAGFSSGCRHGLPSLMQVRSFKAGPKVDKTLVWGGEIGRTVYQALRTDWVISWFCTWADPLAEVTSEVLLD